MPRLSGAEQSGRRLSASLDLASFADFRGRAEVAKRASRSWASATFVGARHVLELHFAGEGAGAAAGDFLDGLGSREFDLPGHVVADIALVSDERNSEGTMVRLVVEALTVEAD